MDTQTFLQDHFSDRIGYRGNLGPVLEKVCRHFDFGDLLSFSKLSFGYQDSNIVIETEKGKFFVKIFSKEHSDQNCREYIKLMEIVHEAGISYPRLIKANQESFFLVKMAEADIRLCVQEYINGDNLASLQHDLTSAEIKQVASQASMINSINYRGGYSEQDTWATRNFLEQYPIKKKALTSQENFVIEPLVEEFRKLNISKLPQAFVHGDIIHTNVMKDNQNKIWIIDFGVSAYQARIIELAVLFHDLIIDLNSQDNTRRMRELALDKYQENIELTTAELNALPILTDVTHAMYLMSSAYMERVLKESFEENHYWFNRSKRALMRG